MNANEQNLSGHVRQIALYFLLAITAARAHDPGLSTALIRLQPGRIDAELTFAPADLAVLLDAKRAAENQPHPVGPGSKQELEAIARESLEVINGGRPSQPETVVVQTDAQNNVHLNLHFRAVNAGPATVRSTLLNRLPRGHREFLSVEDERGARLQERMLDTVHDTFELGPIAAVYAERETRTSSFADFLALGVRHIWTGYDHLLFLFALLVVSRGFLAAARIITAFTVAHSITLAAATLNLVNLSPRIVEPLIAASIVFVGIENLVRRGEPKGRAWLTFSFGLVHGLGFASALRELGVGAAGSGIAVPLLSFNLGVELGQIAVAALVLPLIWWARKQPLFLTRLAPACSVLVVLAGGFWVVERAFGFL